ncbi:hypothetical protein KKA14_19160 [bacterium]|nr:hypothetical protein [bacterium]
MKSYAEIFNRVFDAIPLFIHWMNHVLESNQKNATPIIDLGFKKINIVFPTPLLKRAKVVIVMGNTPFPPLSEIGLHESYDMERMPIAGITYKDTYFVTQNHHTESLCFHEMIHVLQWDKLGVERFLLAYGIGLARFGYDQNPFEKMAHTYQRKLDTNALPMNFLKLVRQEIDTIWNQINPLYNL